ncbi:diacylglycerol kinase [Paenibacillus sp. J31TS4]|uniref:diacylglycerol kinase n=1 Tax=Paenibacillus sp. J31TS4 TaxID=2807195 RepID=UPI001B0CA5C5|nr:diacylglycerol kinase [Paenibacillus sp. J31TS4]GIP39616.1 diacylglycerol kinase [Paenibacillus sp. J31TS4]
MKPAPRWSRSFRYAYEGLKHALATQRNMKFHFAASLVALLSALWLRLGKLEILFLLAAITLVIVTELINTAVEKAVDLAMPDRHPLAKIAKDVAAGAVLVAALFAAAVGSILFYEPVAGLIAGSVKREAALSAAAVWLYLALVLVTLVLADTRFSAKRRLRPSLWTAAAFSLATLIALLTPEPLAALLAYSMAALFLAQLFRRRTRTLPTLLFGAALGAILTALAYWLHTIL